MHILPPLRHAARSLRRSPGFVLTAAALLSIGIAANAFLLSALSALFLRATPGVRAPQELHWIQPSTTERTAFGLSLDDLSAIESSPLVRRVAAFSEAPVAVTVAGRPSRRSAQFVSRDYFAVLGTSSLRGRLFAPEETVPGASAPVAVISYRLAAEAFGDAGGAVGKTLRLGGSVVTVVGIVAPDFNGAGGLDRRDLWLPLALYSRVVGDPPDRALVGVARVGAVQNVTAVAEALRAIIAPGYERDHAGRSVIVRLASARAGLGPDELQDGLPVVVIGGLLALTLLFLTFANVGNLLLARAIGRRHQLSVLAAIGASRTALSIQIAAEGILCALAGAAAGVVVVAGAVNIFNAQAGALHLTLDAGIVVFSGALALVTGIVFSLAPALRSTRNLASSIRVGTTATAPRLRLQTVFVSIQLATSFAALAVAGIFVAALQRTIAAPSGYATAERIVVISADPGLMGYSPDKARDLRERIVRGVEATPGIERVAFADILPLGGRNVAQGWMRSARNDRADLATWHARVSQDYFAVLGLRVVQGREFSAPDAMGEAVVNEELARRLFPSENAVGRAIWRDDGGGPIQIVGVVAAAKYHTMMETPRPFVYLPYGPAGAGAGELTVFARARQAGPSALQSVETALRTADPNLPVLRVSYFDRVIADRNGPVRLIAAVLGATGLLATLIAAAGVFAVGSYLGNARRRELAIRSALGARRKQLVSFMVKQGMAIIAGGIAGGIALATLSLQALRGMVSELGEANVLVLMAASLLLGLSAIAALLAPAIQASAVDPVETLKST